MSRGFDHIEAWVFDLDNTLYPASCRLFGQIDQRMAEFIGALLKVDRAEAKRIQKGFFHEHGTTLRGLMTVHGIAPEAFLKFVHDIDHSAVPAAPELALALKTLPGRKLVFTNGTCYHAERVLDRLGIRELIDDVFDIVHCGFIPKPQREPYVKFVERTGIAPERAAMFEDIARNLEPPHELGMTTVLVQSPENTDGNIINAPLGNPAAAPFIDHVTSDLAGFLAAIAAVLGNRPGALK
ncbi:MAG TPA: pyrimidine 5'-nucleotidase [Aestuariivirgaceae bacterium]|nr:pyrimidine 5'-nucleotidase [Aestuariivirgaceae bacterium]